MALSLITPPNTAACGGSHTSLTSTFPRCFNIEVKDVCSCGVMLVGWMREKKRKKEEEREEREREEREREREREREEERKEERKRKEEKEGEKGSENNFMEQEQKEKRITKKGKNEIEEGKSPREQKAKKKAVVTERDIKIMQEINRHGFMGAEEVSRVFKMAKMTAYIRLQKLVEISLIKHARILYAYPGVYWLTFAGKGTCKSGLSTISTVSAATFEHDIRLLRLYLDLKERYKEKLKDWQTPRELRAQKFNLYGDTASGFKAMKSHTPDALITMDLRSAVPAKIALELELSPKSTPRLKEIIEGYATALQQGRINRVVYYCAGETIKRRVIEHIERTNTANLFQVTVLQEP